MMRRSPPSRRSNSALEKVSFSFCPLCRTFSRSSSAIDEALLEVAMVMVVVPFCSAVLWGEIWGRRPGLLVAQRFFAGFPGERYRDQGDGRGAGQIPGRRQGIGRRGDQEGRH